jgi:hypothetical protein
VVLSQGLSGTDSGSALQVRSDRSLLSGKGQAPITARSPDIASLIRATLARSRLVMVASSALQGTARVQSERSPLRCRRHARRLNHQLGGALPSAALLDVVGLPKDERSRVGERGDRGAVLQHDGATELGGPAALSVVALHRVPINALFRLPARTSRSLDRKVRQLARLGSVCGASRS